MNETNIFCCKQASAVAQIRILGEARWRREEGLPDWSNIARRDTAVDLEVGPSDIAAVAGSDWGDVWISTSKGPVVQIDTHGKERLWRLRLLHRTCPSEGALTSYHVSQQC